MWKRKRGNAWAVRTRLLGPIVLDKQSLKWGQNFTFILAHKLYIKRVYSIPAIVIHQKKRKVYQLLHIYVVTEDAKLRVGIDYFLNLRNTKSTFPSFIKI